MEAHAHRQQRGLRDQLTVGVQPIGRRVRDQEHAAIDLAFEDRVAARHVRIGHRDIAARTAADGQPAPRSAESGLEIGKEERSPAHRAMKPGGEPYDTLIGRSLGSHSSGHGSHFLLVPGLPAGHRPPFRRESGQSVQAPAVKPILSGA